MIMKIMFLIDCKSDKNFNLNIQMMASLLNKTIL
jgi:hypothetical protein